MNPSSDSGDPPDRPYTVRSGGRQSPSYSGRTTSGHDVYRTTIVNVDRPSSKASNSKTEYWNPGKKKAFEGRTKCVIASAIGLCLALFLVIVLMYAITGSATRDCSVEQCVEDRHDRERKVLRTGNLTQNDSKTAPRSGVLIFPAKPRDGLAEAIFPATKRSDGLIFAPPSQGRSDQGIFPDKPEVILVDPGIFDYNGPAVAPGFGPGVEFVEVEHGGKAPNIVFSGRDKDRESAFFGGGEQNITESPDQVYTDSTASEQDSDTTKVEDKPTEAATSGNEAVNNNEPTTHTVSETETTPTPPAGVDPVTGGGGGNASPPQQGPADNPKTDGGGGDGSPQRRRRSKLGDQKKHPQDVMLGDEPAHIPISGPSAVVSRTAACSAIGRNILEDDGSAVDAAIATLVCEGVHSPQSAGIGGGFQMVVYSRDIKSSVVINALEGTETQDSDNGYHAHEVTGSSIIAVPGAVRGYELAHKLFGSLPWSRLFKRSIQECKHGILISRDLAHWVKSEQESVLQSKLLRDLFLNSSTGEVLKEGDLMKCSAMASTLEIIASEGADKFYTGALSDKLLLDLRQMGVMEKNLSPEKMSAYDPGLVDPVVTDLNGANLLTVPSFNGDRLATFLKLVNTIYPNAQQGKTMHSNAEEKRFYQRFVTAAKMTLNRHAPLPTVPMSTTQDPSGSSGAEKLNMQKEERPQLAVHVSVLAPNGDAVSASATLNNPFGSGVGSPTTGVILNNGQLPDASEALSPAIVVDDNGDVQYILGVDGDLKQGILTEAFVYARHRYVLESLDKAINVPRVYFKPGAGALKVGLSNFRVRNVNADVPTSNFRGLYQDAAHKFIEIATN